MTTENTSKNRPGLIDMIAGVVVGAGTLIGLRYALPEVHKALGDFVAGGLAGAFAVITMSISRKVRLKGQ